MQNVELKARLADLAAAERTCERLGAERVGTLHQRDTYFRVPRGRLKLREIDGERAELIAYERPDTESARVSDYTLEPVQASIRETLDRALGTLAVVEKARRLWLWRGVRIHLDEVTGLGSFLEFEGVVEHVGSIEEAERRVAHLRTEFGIGDADLLAISYLDMVTEVAR